MASASALSISGSALSTKDVVNVARFGQHLELADEAVQKIERAHALLQESISDDEPHYGINTGFGALGRVRIDDDDLRQLQVNLIRSHSTGVGKPLPRSVVRGTILLLIGSLARGHSGSANDHRAEIDRSAESQHHAGRTRNGLGGRIGGPRSIGAHCQHADWRG